ncbi:MAG: translation initiation factor IF-2 [Cyanobacteriota bacterium]
MTSGGKVRIYELSRDLGLDNRDVLEAAEKLSIAVRSHSSSISDDEAHRIRAELKARGGQTGPSRPSEPAPAAQILTVRKAAQPPVAQPPAVKAPAAKPPAAKVPAPPAAAPTPVSPPPRPAAAAPTPPPARPTPPPPPARPATAARPPAATPPPPSGAAAPGKPASRPPARPAVPVRPAAGAPPAPRSPGSPPAPARPTIVSRPAAAVQPPARPATPSRPSAPPSRTTAPPSSAQRPVQPVRPAAAAGRPQQPNRPAVPMRPGAPQRPAVPQRGPVAGAPRQGQPPVRRGDGEGRPPSPGVELVGKPIRRDTSTPPVRPGQPVRPGAPGGMRKPVAPGELMQLQKPGARSPVAPEGPRRPPARPGVEAPRRPNDPAAKPEGTAATAPRRPGHRPPVGAGPARARRPDWDDTARLDALRSKSPQRQRQKVHIIGENDDSLTAETGGFAGEQDAIVLQASLARPSKPKSAAGSPRPIAQRRRRKETTRQRQRRRAMELRAARDAKQVRPEMLVIPEGNLTVQELADMLGVESSEIIKSLFFKGIIATVTQTLDLPTIETVSDEFGVPVLQDDVEEAARKTVEMIEASDLAHLIRRPPVVTVMGHVDHGKTSLLDAIRKTRVAAGEAGGITQHIGAYQVEVPHGEETRKVTFLDTPGHEAFTAMRARGTKVTDVAVLVVAADDGVRPQTLEAISHARAAEVPIVVAINKVDKEGAQIDRVKQELSDQNLLPEEWGGTTVMVPVSALRGTGLNTLLDMILLVTEVEDLQANPDRMARGTVIEAHLDKAKGPVATLLIQNGTLRPGDVVAAGPVLGKVKAMVDDTGRRVKDAPPSSAVEVLGFSEVPAAGDEFEVFSDEKSARAVVGDRVTEARASRLAQQMASRRVSLTSMSGQASEGELKELNLILKADVQGSVEAILGSLEQLPQGEVQVRVLLAAPGEVTETDVDLAAASGAVIVGFNTSLASGARRAAEASGVDVRDYDVIYKLLEDIQLAMEGLLEPELVEQPLGEAEVRAVFTIGKGAVAGCYVTSGSLQRNARFRLHRGKQVAYTGDLDSLKRMKNDVKEVNTGFECGVACDRFTDWREGDRIEAYRMVTQRRTLST